jgi:Zn-dependent membrane protease YugP
MILDPLYFAFTLPPLALSLWAQYRVKSTFERYSRVSVASGLSGAEAAAAIVRAGGMQGVSIERHQGFLSDHYDPRSRTLRLSPDVYDGRSISSIAVAAHEAGHSIQHATGYGPLALRSALVPAVQIGSSLWYLPFVIGLMMHLAGLMWIGVACFAAIVLFQLVTLPTEYNASNRAKAVLVSSGIVSGPEEQAGVAKVLDAAALTYLAALIASVMQLIYMVLRAQDRR